MARRKLDRKLLYTDMRVRSERFRKNSSPLMPSSARTSVSSLVKYGSAPILRCHRSKEQAVSGSARPFRHADFSKA